MDFKMLYEKEKVNICLLDQKMFSLCCVDKAAGQWLGVEFLLLKKYKVK